MILFGGVLEKNPNFVQLGSNSITSSHPMIIVHITHLSVPITFDVVLMLPNGTSFEQGSGRSSHLIALKFELLASERDFVKHWVSGSK